LKSKFLAKYRNGEYDFTVYVKNLGYTMEKFILMQPWIKKILMLLRKDLKNELISNKSLFRSFFANKAFNNITGEEIVNAYEKKLYEGNKELGAWIVSRWIYHNSEIYQYFYSELEKINPNVEEIKNIDKEKALKIIEGSINSFGIENTYIFSILNEVAFDQELLDDLRKKTLFENEKNNIEEKIQVEKNSIETLQKKYNEDLNRLKEKYEQKIFAMKKKYFDDTFALKNQVSQLQKKLYDR
jgi:hypothetical protein